jgi:hypothetical protein
MWFYKGKQFITPPEDAFGFIYMITCIDKNSDKYGWIYVGKKFFLHATKKKVSKKTKTVTKTRKKTIRGTKDSGWLTYYGSSLPLKADVKLIGEDGFRREILCFCRNKAELTYMELVHQIKHEVLFVPSWNGWINGKVYRSHLNT